MKDLEVRKTGTTTLAIKCKDGIVVAADKRATAGYQVVNRKTQKIQFITPNILSTIAGVASDAMRVIKVIQAEVKLNSLKLRREMRVKEVSSLMASMAYKNIRTPSTITPITGFIVSGTDVLGSHIYEISPAGDLNEVETFASDGSGSIYAIGVLEDSFEENITIKQAVDLAKRALNVAMLKDTASGNGFQIYSITADGSKLEADVEINTGYKV
jgi:proteasome beta subunit